MKIFKKKAKSGEQERRGPYRKASPEERLKEKVLEAASQKVDANGRFADRLIQKYLGLPPEEAELPATEDVASPGVDDLEAEVIAEALRDDPSFRAQVKEAYLIRMRGGKTPGPLDQYDGLLELLERAAEMQDRMARPASQSLGGELAKVAGEALKYLPQIIAVVQQQAFLQQGVTPALAQGATAIPSAGQPEASDTGAPPNSDTPPVASAFQGWQALLDRLVVLLDKPPTAAADAVLAVLAAEEALGSPLPAIAYAYVDNLDAEQSIAFLQGQVAHVRYGPHARRLLTDDGQQWVREFTAAIKEMAREDEDEDAGV